MSVVLQLVDGLLELSEGQKEKLLNNPYFEALFLRWSREEQTEYQVELTAASVKFLLGEISQLEIFTTVSRLAIQEARQELEMIGAQLQPADLEVPEYPWCLRPLLEPYQIRPGSVLASAEKSLALYRHMFQWNQLVKMTDLEIFRDQPTFPTYVQLFWEKDPIAFYQTKFSLALMEFVFQHPEMFVLPLGVNADSFRLAVGQRYDHAAWFQFFATVGRLDVTNWIMVKLNSQPYGRCDYTLMKTIIQLDRSMLFACLSKSAQANVSKTEIVGLLQVCDGCDTCPLTKEQIGRLPWGCQDEVKDWIKRQVFHNANPKEIQANLQYHLDNRNSYMVHLILERMPFHPFQLTVKNHLPLIKEVIHAKEKYPHLQIIIHPDVYQRDQFTTPVLDFILTHDPTPSFGLCKCVFSACDIEILIKHRVYLLERNAFLGNKEVALPMFRLAIEVGAKVHSEYLLYFVREKIWDELPLYQTVYQTHEKRMLLLQIIIQRRESHITKQFLAWETALH